VGSNVFRVFPDQKRVLELSTGKVDPFATNLAAILMKETNFKYDMRQDKLDGRSVDVIVMKLLSPAERQLKQAADKTEAKTQIPLIAKEEKWIDHETHLIYQLLAFDKHGDLISGTRYFNVQTNVDLPESLFTIPQDYSREADNSASHILKQIVGGGNISAAKSNPKTAGYIFLTLLILQGGGLLVWALLRRKSKR